MSTKPPVICDTGSGFIKAGFAGEPEPALHFANLIGRPNGKFDAALGDATGAAAAAGAPERLVGDEASNLRSMLQLSRPIQNGIVQNWDDMEAVWDFTFSRLGVTPSEHKVVQTEAALNPPRNRERIVETMFERYGFAGVNVSVQAILALNSQGQTSGLVVDSGDGVTHLVPVTKGYLEPALVQRVNLAGRHITENLTKLLVGQGHPVNSTADFETVREMKQKLCYVAYDLESEKRLARETTVIDRQYTLPDKSTIRVGAERFLAPELLFNPAAFGQGEEGGLADWVFKTIRRSDIHMQKDLFSYIILSGGTTMFPGMSSRLEKDVRRLYVESVLKNDRSQAADFKCIVEDPPRRQHMVFVGASILASAYEQEPGSGWFITRQEYLECGASIVQRLIPTQLS